MNRHLIISVNYNGFSQTDEMLKSLAATNAPIDVVVVDNSQDEEEFKRLTALKAQHRGMSLVVIDSTENLGYMGGLNLGLMQSNVSEYDCVILCNNDITFRSDFFDRLNNAFDVRTGNTLCFAPFVRDSKTQTNLNPFLLSRPSKIKIAYLSVLYKNFYCYLMFRFLKKLVSRIGKTPASAADIVGPVEIYAPHGSIFILDAGFAQDGFDDKYFLYAEELTVAEACLARGGRVVYDPTIEITHISHSSTASVESRALFDRKASAIRYVRKKYVFS